MFLHHGPGLSVLGYTCIWALATEKLRCRRGDELGLPVTETGLMPNNSGVHWQMVQRIAGARALPASGGAGNCERYHER